MAILVLASGLTAWRWDSGRLRGRLPPFFAAIVISYFLVCAGMHNDFRSHGSVMGNASWSDSWWPSS